MEENKNDFSSLLYPLLLMVFSSSNQPNVALEKEVSYLQGKIDTLENFVVNSK